MLENLAKTSQQLSRLIQRNSPTILTGLAVTGLVTTVIMAIKAAPKAYQLLDDYNFDRSIGSGEPTTVEVIRVTWKVYIPTILMGTSTIACIVTANSIHLRRNAALMGIYSLTESALREYQSKVVETIGKGKELTIRDEIAQDKLTKNPIENNTVILTGKGDILCYDSLSGRYFKNDIENIRRIQNNFNSQVLGDMFISLNDLYFDLGLDPIDLGGQVGWSYDYLLDIRFTAKIATDGQPCVVLEFATIPKDYAPAG